MNRHLWKLSALLIPLALFVWSPAGALNPAFAGPHEGQDRGDFRPNSEYTEPHQQIISQLSLTPEQQAKFKELRESGKAQGKALHQDLHAKKQELITYLRSPDASEARALALQAEVGSLQAKLGAKRIHVWFQMRGVL